MVDRRAGGCNCGAIRFTALGDPRFIANCHCAACRKATGAAFSTYVGFSSDQVTWSGETRAIFESSLGVKRGFCGACGAPTSYEGAKWPGETHLFIGAFDDATDLLPTTDVFTDEALGWAHRQKG